MTAANNIHSLLTGKTGAFIDALNPSDAVRDKILGARRDIRGHLRDRFDKLSKDASAQQAWGLLPNSVNVVQPLRLRPLFFTQGSYAYKTWNAPAHSSQEIDLDDGLYLPISAFENAGNPRLASAALFAVVDEMLAELCRVKGWRLATDKKTCCRVHLGFGAHIDIPLYAVPDEDTRLLEKATAAYNFRTATGSICLAQAFDAQPELVRLDSDKVWLAHRATGWEQSDPRKLHDWFELQVKDYGIQLRRTCRYVKAWRDWHSKDSPLSSIAIMAHVVNAFRQDEPIAGRDDLTLLAVAERLSTSLAEPISNPVSPNQLLDGSLGDAERIHALKAARQWHTEISKSMTEIFDASRVIETLRSQSAFGPRIPYWPHEITIEAAEKAVMSIAPAVLPTREIPNRSVSG